MDRRFFDGCGLWATEIEAKALHKLKHPSRSREIRGFLDN